MAADPWSKKGLGVGIPPFTPPAPPRGLLTNIPEVPRALGLLEAMMARAPAPSPSHSMPPSVPPLSSFLGLGGVPSEIPAPNAWSPTIADLLGIEPRQRVAFFSFHFKDSFRVNNVRKAFEFDKSVDLRFVDGSLWESRKLDGPEAIKRLIREGMEGTSVVCVLTGSETWSRRWVKYEIARSVIDGKGLLAVHINGINHHEARRPHPRGINPLSRMAVGKLADGTYRLFELTKHGWDRYGDYEWSVSLPRYLPDPAVGYVMPLNVGAMEYDYSIQNGRQNIGGWLNLAATLAGRD